MPFVKGRTQPSPRIFSPARLALRHPRPVLRPSRLAPQAARPVPQAAPPAPQPARSTPPSAHQAPSPARLAPQSARPAPSPPAGVPAARPARLRGPALALILTAAFMVVLDFSIVNVALPSIETELG